MSQSVASLKPVYFTEEEALALLDVCLLSSGDTDPVKESALLKITDLIRRYISAGQSKTAAQGTVTLPTEPMPACILSWLDSTAEADIVEDREETERLSDRKHRVYNALLSLVS